VLVVETTAVFVMLTLAALLTVARALPVIVSVTKSASVSKALRRLYCDAAGHQKGSSIPVWILVVTNVDSTVMLTFCVVVHVEVTAEVVVFQN
jgi:hypothetical protein